MAANRIVTAQGAVDQTAESFVAFIGKQTSGVLWDPYWYCRLVEDGYGDAPARAEVVIRNSFAAVDEQANMVAWNPDGISGQIKMGMDLRVYRSFQTRDQDGNPKGATELVFGGRISGTKEFKDIGADELVVIAQDARTELQKIRVQGRVIFVPATGAFDYQAGWRPHFNPGGRPNCVFDQYGNPWFAPYPDYGIGFLTHENPVSTESQNTQFPCYWTLGTMLMYAFNVYGPAGPWSSVAPDFAFFPYVARCPKWIQWPSTFAMQIDSEIEAEFNQGIGQNNTSTGSSRKGVDLDATGLYLVGSPGSGPGLFDLIFEKSGYYTYDLQPRIDDATGTITGEPFAIYNILVTCPKVYTSASKAIDLPFAAGGDAATTLNTGCITGGTISKDASNLVTRTVGLGGLVKIETRLSTAAGGGLVNGWQDARFTQFMATWLALGGHNLAFQQTCKQYPEVLNQVHIDPAFDFTAGTAYAGRPRAQIPRPIWPFLLSMLGADYGPRDSLSYPCPIQVEVDTVGDGTGWQVATEFSIQEVSDAGMIVLETLRQLPLSQDPNSPGIWAPKPGKTIPISSVNDIQINPVRFTMAIPCDDRLTYALRMTSDELDGVAVGPNSKFFDTNGESPDADALDSSFSRTAVLELKDLYQLWIQSSSWPIPQSSGAGSVQNNQQLRDDTALLQSHVRRSLRESFRLDRSGSSLVADGTFMTSVKPGALIRNLIPRGLGASSTRKPCTVKAAVARRQFMFSPGRDSQGNPSWKTRTVFLLR